ncbi:hypothetical protein [Actinophytocola oryzae]|uniref:DUF3558 domain-containing protein n=1 Tax=Actinophytocola oryzae TaxID=502181 RepID=A0A4R7V218_9PSEU|nr:hypothetical protein [Actinophytocola oryzae]TDV42592.1 hypothetical protein CLV71_11762 [Actinophytocola oryzae]
MRIGLVALIAALALGGCTTSTPPDAPAVPVFTSARPEAGRERTVPDSCDAVATLDDLSRILATFVTGPVQRVVGVPQDNIGRTARLDCYYGVPAGQPTSAAPVWIGLAGYVDDGSARERVAATVADARAATGTVGVNDVAVGSDRGVLIRSANWMLVATRGRTTVVVQAVPALVRENDAGLILGQVADFALTGR